MLETRVNKQQTTRVNNLFCNFVKAIHKPITMNTKLTLTIEQEIIESAKQYAKGKNRSLSDIIENYLKTLTKEDRKHKKLSPVIESLKGSFKMPKNMDYKKELAGRLEKKYL